MSRLESFIWHPRSTCLAASDRYHVSKGPRQEIPSFALVHAG
jgi:hypothetical protein